MTQTYSTAAQITAALAADGFVQLQEGEILLTETIVVPGNSRLVGSGFTTRLNCNGDFPAITLSTVERPRAVQIANLRITRSNTVGAVANQHLSDGIKIIGDDVTVENVWIEDCYKGIHIADSATVSTNVRLGRVKVSHSSPTAFNSHSGIYLEDVNGIDMEQCPVTGTHTNGWLSISTGVTNRTGVARMFTLAAPAAASATAVHASFAGNNASNNFPGAFTNPDVPRNVTATFANGWDGGDITITGTDQFGIAQTEVIADQNNTTVAGTKIFATVTAATKQSVGAAAAGCSLGTGVILGVPAVIIDANGLLANDDVVEAVTVSNTVHGYTATNAPDASNVYKFIANVLR